MELKTSNPAFAGKTFEGTATHLGYGQTSAYGSSMTISGTVNKAGILMLCVLDTAAWTWNQYFTTGNPASVGSYTMIGAFGGFIVAMVTIFKKEWSPITAPIYALLEGLFLDRFRRCSKCAIPALGDSIRRIDLRNLFRDAAGVPVGPDPAHREVHHGGCGRHRRGSRCCISPVCSSVYSTCKFLASSALARSGFSSAWRLSSLQP